MEYAIKNQENWFESIEFNVDAIQTIGSKQPIILQVKLEGNNFVKQKQIPVKDTVTLLSYPEEVICKLISRSPFQYSMDGLEIKYRNKKKISDFLYEIDYGNIDYDYAYEHFIPVSGACSSIRNKNFFGRNFDWLYNNQVTFVVHTPQSTDHYAVLGVSGIIPNVTTSNVNNDTIIVGGIDYFKLVPFYLLDGINEKGVFCTHNVVPLDDTESPTTIITAKIEEKDKVSIPMLTRFILDKFKSAQEAIDYIIDYTTVFFTEDMIDLGYQSHFLIGDNKTTYIIEFINGEIKISNRKYITNFTVSDVLFNDDDTIIYPNPTESGINKYGQGLERWDIIANNYTNTQTLNGMRELLELLKFTNSYGEPFWYSEIVKTDDDEENPITVDTDPSNCTESKAAAIELFQERTRNDPKTWCTCHSSIYDIKLKKLYIRSQEGNIDYVFKL